MIVTQEYIEKKFGEFNEQYFANELPRIPIKLVSVKSFLGKFCYKLHRRFFIPNEITDIQLRINTRLDWKEQLLEDTLIHEMIHYYIFHKKIKDTSPHGVVFRKMMKDINTTYGRHMTISYKPTADELKQLAKR